jgi:transglutaminase-like putative cysteine protease
MIIAYFLLFAALLYERSLFAAVYLLGLVWITTVGLLQLGRRGRLLPNGLTAKVAGRLLLHALPIMLVLFLLFPRLPGPLWGIPPDSSSGTSGLSEEMSPGDITRLGLSEEVAFRVEFLTRPPRARDLYWRGPVLADFNGRTWSRDQRRRSRLVETLELEGESIDYRVMLEASGQRWVLALDMPARWSSTPNLVMGSDYQLRVPFGGQMRSRLEYRVSSHTDYRAREPLSEREREQFRYLPDGSNPRTRALAASWLRDGPSPDETIERALDYLRSEPFFYTLTPPALGNHTADEFLFDTRRGFCEHYASAFAVMMRAAGLPARIVTGYQGGELNTVGDYYIIRQSDAHAWTEVWLEDRGWVRVDPTAAVAPQRIALGSSRNALSGALVPGTLIGRLAWVRDALLVWDAANTYWTQWVVGYGPALQRDLLQALGFDASRWSRRWPVLLGLAMAATVAVSVALAVYLGWAERRRARVDPAARHFEVFCRRLAALDVAPRAPGEGPLAYARRAQHLLPRVAGDIEQIVTTYLQARYEPDVEQAALERLRRSVAGFRPRHA